MKTDPSKSLLYFFLASLFSVSAQSFLFVPQQQAVLLDGFLRVVVFIVALVLLLAAYLNFYLAFYQYSDKQARIIGSFSALVLFGLVFLYGRAALYVEALLLFIFAVLSLLVLWADALTPDWLGRASFLINFFFGVLILIPQMLEGAVIYERALSYRLLFSMLFVGTALLKLFANRWSDETLSLYATKFLSVPWIGWAFLFSVDVEIPILLPAILFSFAFLSCGLLPFEKFR